MIWDIDLKGRVMMDYKFSSAEYLNPPADARALEELASNLDFDIPSDYLDFLRSHDGGEGFVGNRYVILWRCRELLEFNREYEVEKYAPGVFLFGSDGGGEGYGFDKDSPELPVISVPFIGMNRKHIKFISRKFSDFV
ncbi:SMI1/KNR4 family protein [Xanthomonas sacchari]|uniref:SMI1/KNR4 family protein n=1 Tax=Xanthomonas sacchari TaxID=56458 RepID=UPI00225E4A39|nr:SMI1/KNR4 family protein [Xanthomonas sacchari]